MTLEEEQEIEDHIYICHNKNQDYLKNPQGFAIAAVSNGIMELKFLATNPDNLPSVENVTLKDEIQKRRDECVGKGVGIALITYLAALCLEKGITSITVEGNLSVPFYEKCKFTKNDVGRFVLNEEGMKALTGATA